MGFITRTGVVAILLVAVLYQVYLKSLLFTVVGLGRQMQSIGDFSYTCRRIEDPRLQACEDMWFSESTRQLFLACSDPVARGQWMPNVGHLNASARSLNDAVIAMDIDIPKGDSFAYRVLKTPGFSGIDGDGRIHLIGLAGRDSKSEVELYLVNARPSIDPITGQVLSSANETIELFTTTPKATSLAHKKTFHNSEIRTPNNIALSPSGHGFYITNDHGTAKSGLSFAAAMYVGNGDVTYCSNLNECKVVAKGFHFPNGLVTGKDGNLYVPSAFAGDIAVYSIDVNTHDLVKINSIDVGYPIDNLSVDRNGDIWAAAIPQLPKLLESFADPLNKIGPSTILRLRNSTEGWKVKKVLEDKDSEILPGATTAIHDVKTGRIFVSGITAPFIAVCDPK